MYRQTAVTGDWIFLLYVLLEMRNFVLLMWSKAFDFGFYIATLNHRFYSAENSFHFFPKLNCSIASICNEAPTELNDWAAIQEAIRKLKKYKSS